MQSKIVIAGGTGFIGRYLADKYRNTGNEVIIISRDKGDISWTDQSAITNALENAELLINLAGKSVDCRYSAANKKAILLSRTETTKALGEALKHCTNPPALWINSATATIYRHSEDRAMTEADGEIGTGFSVDVAKAWEKSFFDFVPVQTRQVALRISIVLGTTGGAIKPLLNLVRSGLGGIQGKGTQMFSWIHIEDLYRIIQFIRNNQSLAGVFNCASSLPVTNEQFMKTLRMASGVPFGLPNPTWLLKIGAFIIRTEPELILKSRWVIPERLEDAGFVFKYKELGDAVREIIGRGGQGVRSASFPSSK